MLNIEDEKLPPPSPAVPAQMRSSEPTRLGTSVSRNCSDTDIVMPALPRLMTTIVQITQTLKPRCSENIDHIRLRRAIRAPVCAQKVSSSGSQWSIQWAPRLRPGGAGSAAAGSAVGAARAGVSVGGATAMATMIRGADVADAADGLTVGRGPLAALDCRCEGRFTASKPGLVIWPRGDRRWHDANVPLRRTPEGHVGPVTASGDGHAAARSSRGAWLAPPLPPLALLAGRRRRGRGRRAGTLVTTGAGVLPVGVVRARRGRAHERLVAGVVVDVPLQPGDHGVTLVGRVGGGRHVGLTVELDVRLLDAGREAAVERLRMRARSGDGVVLGADDHRGHADARPALGRVPRLEGHHGLEGGTVVRRLQ